MKIKIPFIIWSSFYKAVQPLVERELLEKALAGVDLKNIDFSTDLSEKTKNQLTNPLLVFIKSQKSLIEANKRRLEAVKKKEKEKEPEPITEEDREDVRTYGLKLQQSRASYTSSDYKRLRFRN